MATEINIQNIYKTEIMPNSEKKIDTVYVG